MQKRDTREDNLRDRHGRPRGILRHEWREERVVLNRARPSEPVAHFVDYFWSARWDLDGLPPRREENLPHPCVHLAIEAGRSGVFGVVRGRFERVLEGRGSVLGVRFRPGGFYPFLARPVSEITDRVLPLDELFGAAGRRLEEEVLATRELDARTQIVDAFLAARATGPVPEVEQVASIAERAADEPSITRVEQLADEFGTTARSLQRLFQRWVGVSPKWVIRRYRLQEAVARMATGEAPDWATLALDLGYSDQAHFSRDFKSVVGTPPGSFAEELRRALGEG